jgi:hypothetical protein
VASFGKRPLRKAQLWSRVAALETQTARATDNTMPRVTIYLPRKDDDTRPPSVTILPGGARLVTYVAGEPMPEGTG